MTTKLKLICDPTDHVVGLYDNKQDAADAMESFIESENDDLEPSDEDWLTPFDFTLEEVKVEEINEVVTDFEAARNYLGGCPNADFSVGQKCHTGNGVKLQDVHRLVQDLNPSHVQALIALNELFSIAQAWNKADGFKPDFSNPNQAKWFPWFVYDKESAGFVYATTANAPSDTYATIGSRLCFKTANRARQFGEQFIDLWNKVLL